MSLWFVINFNICFKLSQAFADIDFLQDDESTLFVCSGIYDYRLTTITAESTVIFL